LLEERSRALYDANCRLEAQAAELAARVDQRTRELTEAQRIAGVGSWQWDLNSNQIRWSDQTYRIFGLDPADAVTMERFVALIHPEDRAYVQARVQTALSSGAADPSYEVEHRLIRPGGTQRWVLGRGLIDLDESGEARGIAGTVQDITEKKQSELLIRATRALAERKTQFLTAILDTIGQGVSVFDADLKLAAWNHRVIDLTGMPAELLYEGADVRDLFRAMAERGDYGDGDVEALVETRYRTLVERRLAAVYREERTLPDGRIVALESAPMAGGGVVTTYSDITEQRRVEKTLLTQQDELRRRVDDLERLRDQLAEARDAAEQSNRTKSRFLAMISHDLRTPINSIIGGLNLLADSGLRGDQADFVAMARSSSELLNALLGDLVDLAQSETGAMRLEPAVFELTKLVTETAAPWRLAAEQKGLAFDASLPAGPVHVRADPARLRQMLNNLLSNAVKYTSQGTVSLSLSALAQQWRFTVRDTGMGIAEADRDRLFKEFSRLDAARGLPGSGLGLAITQRLARLMGGEVALHSADPAGTEFHLTLPLPAVKAPAPAARPAGARPLLTSAGAAPRILLAEDVPANQMIAKLYLEKLGCVVDLAANGAEAIDAVQARPYDAVLMDVDMPVMDGHAATAAIRALKGQDLPILMVTAYTDEQTRQACRHCGADGMTAKPLEPGKLAALLQDHLSAKRAAGAAATAERGAGQSPLDEDALARLSTSLGADAVKALLIQAVGDIARALEEAEQATNSEALESATHKLKSLGQTFGTPGLADPARVLNRRCRAGEAFDRLAAERRALVRDGRSALEHLNRRSQA